MEGIRKMKTKQKYNTKYKIGEKLYYFENNQINCSEVSQIDVCIYKDGSYHETYTFNPRGDFYSRVVKSPRGLFKSKEELIESLSSQYEG